MSKKCTTPAFPWRLSIKVTHTSIDGGTGVVTVGDDTFTVDDPTVVEILTKQTATLYAKTREDITELEKCVFTTLAMHTTKVTASASGDREVVDIASTDEGRKIVEIAKVNTPDGELTLEAPLYILPAAAPGIVTTVKVWVPKKNGKGGKWKKPHEYTENGRFSTSHKPAITGTSPSDEDEEGDNND